MVKPNVLIALAIFTSVNAMPAHAQKRPAVYSPAKGVLCDRYVCADSKTGVSPKLTERYLGKKAAKKLSSDIDPTEFTFIGGIFCDVKEKLCREDRYYGPDGKRSGAVSKKYTKLLFGNSLRLAADPKDATYFFEGEPVTLVNGVSEVEAAPGSAAKDVTRYFGNEVELDLNGDGLKDVAFLLENESGGSGTFYYAVAALKTPEGYRGTNAVFLGDRIAPQSTAVDEDAPTQFIVSYGDRAEGKTFADEPTMMVSKTFKVNGQTLIEVKQ